jgi:hypothetical protein
MEWVYRPAQFVCSEAELTVVRDPWHEWARQDK